MGHRGHGGKMEVTEQDSTGVWLCALWFGLCDTKIKVCFPACKFSLRD